MTRADEYSFRSKMRLFLAIELPEKIKNSLVAVQNQLKPFFRAKYVEKNNLHITLKFLGEVENVNSLNKLSEAKFNPFRISLSRIGVFPNPNYIKVVWVGVKDGAEEVVKLHDEIESKIPFEKDRNFNPHITIARLKSRVDDKAKKKMNSISFNEEFEVREFVLCKSTLTPSGPFYEKLSSFPK